jgi:hypothetical protein
VKDITVRLQNRPGTLAAAAAALDRAGLAIQGVCGFAIDGRGLRHLLVEDGEYERVLESAGAELVEQREALLVPVGTGPGWLAAVTSRLGQAGVNIEVIYMAVNNHLVIVPNDIEKARAALPS